MIDDDPDISLMAEINVLLAELVAQIERTTDPAQRDACRAELHRQVLLFDAIAARARAKRGMPPIPSAETAAILH